MLVAKAEFLDAMGEVVIILLHEAGHVGVRAHDGQHLARRHVEVARHLVEGVQYSTGVQNRLCLTLLRVRAPCTRHAS